ncbi:MAG: ABC transporter ATP-binding protein [Fibrobacteres bacterium]|nr:ABC transporter ATP-binding protein [Fibrobacterota bacterium]
MTPTSLIEPRTTAPAIGIGAGAVSCRNLHVTFPGKTGPVEALGGVDLDIPKGSLFVLLGPNGAGKTTLMRCITGLVKPTSGSIAVLGSSDGGDRSRLARLGVLIENPGVYGRLSAREYLSFFASFYGLADAGDRIDGICREFGIPLDGKPCGKLSQGNRQKLHLARSLLHRPELLLWDEPTDHLDPDSQREVLGYLGRYLAEAGATALVATHRLEQMEAVATHFGFLAQGALRAAGERAAILGAAGGPARVRLGFAAPAQAADRAWMETAFSARVTTVPGDALALEAEAEGLFDRMPALLRAVVERGLLLASAEPIRPTLADAYARFTGAA